MEMQMLDVGLSLFVGSVAGWAAASWFISWRLNLAAIEQLPVALGERHVYLVASERYHHLQVCELRCNRRDAERSAA